MEEERSSAGFGLERERSNAGFGPEQERRGGGFEMEEERSSAGFRLEHERSGGGLRGEERRWSWKYFFVVLRILGQSLTMYCMSQAKCECMSPKIVSFGSYLNVLSNYIIFATYNIYFICENHGQL